MEPFDYDIDLVAGTLSLRDQAVVAMPPEVLAPMRGSNIQRISVRPSQHEAILRLPPHLDVVVELAGRRSTDDVLQGRKIAYLDQNHWSTVAAWRTGFRAVSAADAEAAELLSELVESGQIVLPVSAGNLVETTPLYGDRRVAIAGTVLGLSRGWRMLNPIAVRAEELRKSLAGQRPPAARGVFAPNIEQLFANGISRPDMSHVPEPFGSDSAELISLLALHDSIVDAKPVPDEGGEAAAERWVRDWERVAQQARDDGFSSQRIRELAHARVLYDLAPELAAILRSLNIGIEEGGRALMDKSDPVAEMPYLSRFRGLLAERLLNRTQKWESNDFIDVQFLPCGAAYADVVIGERQNIDYLQRVKQVPPGGALAKTLAEGVALLEESLGAS